MKKIFVTLFAIIVLLTSCGREDRSFLTSPSYMTYIFFGSDSTLVYEKEDYAVITMPLTFFIYDKNKKEITHAYSLDADKAFAPGYLASPVLDYKKDQVILEGRDETFADFRDFYYIYDVKNDKFSKVVGRTGYISRCDEIDSEYCLGYDYGKDLTPELESCPPIELPENQDFYSELNDEVMKKLFFKSRFTGKRIYPFKNNFNKKDFEIK